MREFCTSGSTEGPGRFPGLLDCVKGSNVPDRKYMMLKRNYQR